MAWSILGRNTLLYQLLPVPTPCFFSGVKAAAATAAGMRLEVLPIEFVVDELPLVLLLQLQLFAKQCLHRLTQLNV